MPGTITLRPIEANLTHNTDLLTKMNPYCVFVLGTQRYNSQICKKGGKHPVWNDSITIPIANENKILVELMDKDKITKDDVIGSFMLDINELASQQHINKWYPLFYKNKPAGEILLDADFSGQGFGQAGFGGQGFEQAGYSGAGFEQTGFTQQSTTTNLTNIESERITERENLGFTNIGETITRQGVVTQEPAQIFTEQRQFVEPHTFLKEVDVVETRPVAKEIEVLEPVKVLKDVQVTEAVPVIKQIETIEPQVVKKQVEVMEPRLVTKQIQVVENVPVMKEVEVIESIPVIKEVETLEPQTFTKTVEVTEQVPVKKQVTVTEPVTLKKAVEFVEPVITTKTITKEVQPSVIVDEKITTEVGPASVIGIQTETRQTTLQETQFTEETRIREQQRLASQNLGTNFNQYSANQEFGGNLSNKY
jgi:hypothetical protein